MFGVFCFVGFLGMFRWFGVIEEKGLLGFGRYSVVVVVAAVTAAAGGGLRRGEWMGRGTSDKQSHVVLLLI